MCWRSIWSPRVPAASSTFSRLSWAAHESAVTVPSSASASVKPCPSARPASGRSAKPEGTQPGRPPRIPERKTRPAALTAWGYGGNVRSTSPTWIARLGIVRLLWTLGPGRRPLPQLVPDHLHEHQHGEEEDDRRDRPRHEDRRVPLALLQALAQRRL